MAFKLGDFTTGNAFYWQDVDLTIYAGNDSGLTPYSIVLTDAAGKTARGFIGAVGAGETLSGMELLTNPGFEGTYVNGVAPNWLVTRGTKSEYTSTPHGGVSAQQIDNPAGNTAYLSAVGAEIIGKLYKFSAWFKALAGTGRWTGSGGNGVNLTFGLGLADVAWAQKVGYLTSRATDSLLYTNLYADTHAVAATNSVVWDDASIQAVLDPPATGVHIVSAYGGSVRAWTTIESGFNPNTITTAVLIQVAQGTASISGGGALTLQGAKGALNSILISGNGSIVPAGQKGGLGLALISGNGAIIPLGQKGGAGSAIISGNGALSASGTKSVSGIAILSGGGLLAVLGTAWWYDRSRRVVKHRANIGGGRSIGKGRTLQKI